jgi:uncharacterized protein YndB with AHSA1/START domain
MEIIKEIEVDASTEEVWRFLSDRDELAGWVGEEVRRADVDQLDDARRLAWTWAPDGVETTVEVELIDVGDRTRVRVVERGSLASARACSVGDAWDDRLFGLEVRCLADRLSVLAR